MEIFCSHVNRVRYRKYYNICNSCQAEWYQQDDIPVVIIGFTTAHEVIDWNLYRTDIKEKDNIC